MPLITRLRLVALAGALSLISTLAFAEASLPLAQLRDIRLPGSATRFDYQSLDPETGLLFIAHLGGREVVVFDTKEQRVTATIPNVSHVQGVLAIPSLKLVYASATGSNEAMVIDENTLHLVARMPAGKYPDGLASRKSNTAGKLPLGTRIVVVASPNLP